MKKIFAKVVFNIPLDREFTYRIPDYLIDDVMLGKRVLVEFGKKTVTGLVCALTESADIIKLKEIKSVIDSRPVLTEKMLEFAKWLSEYYIAGTGEVVFSFIPSKLNIESDVCYQLNQEYKSNLDKVRIKDDFYGEIISIFERDKNKKFKINQIQKKLNIKNINEYIKFLTENLILDKISIYTNQHPAKTVKSVYRKFKPGSDIEELIFRHKIKSFVQKQLLELLAKEKKLELSEIRKDIKISPSSLLSLCRKGLIDIIEEKKLRDVVNEFEEEKKEFQLTDEQKFCIEQITDSISKNEFETFLLHGVTGSGKTEVYMQAIKKVLEQGKTAITLVPEISLTPQLIYRYRSRFGDIIGVIHSKLSTGERVDVFERIINGTYKIVIGARSALFAPLRNTGIIIVDEEHDQSYKQNNSPRYNARDASIMRGKIENAVVILGSATPSVESYFNALNGKYRLLKMLTRATNINMPEIKIVDLSKKEDKENLRENISGFLQDRNEFIEDILKLRVKFLSKELVIHIAERLEKKEGVIILQNKRGYHSYYECLDCNNVETCPRCSIAMTYHKTSDTLKCHYCGYRKDNISNCSKCGSKKVIHKGTGTERVEEELIEIFPEAIIKRMDSDVYTSKGMLQRVLKDFYDRKIDILVGTQIISKGLDFPEVTLVGVINADIGLLLPDFRATEKTFQILTQVAGRSGRSRKSGEVLIQTNHSDYYVFDYVKNYDYINFFEKEIESRKKGNYPPFCRIAIIEIKSKQSTLAEFKIKEIFNHIKELNKNKIFDVFSPIPPLYSKLKDYYRFHILIKSSKNIDPSGKNLSLLLNRIKTYIYEKSSSKIRFHIDMDAMDLL